MITHSIPPSCFAAAELAEHVRSRRRGPPVSVDERATTTLAVDAVLIVEGSHAGRPICGRWSVRRSTPGSPTSSSGSSTAYVTYSDPGRLRHEPEERRGERRRIRDRGRSEPRTPGSGGGIGSRRCRPPCRPRAGSCRDRSTSAAPCSGPGPGGRQEAGHRAATLRNAAEFPVNRRRRRASRRSGRRPWMASSRTPRQSPAYRPLGP